MLLLVATALADDPGDVIELNERSFKDGIADKEIVKFYVPW